MSNQIAKYVFELQKTSGRLPFQGYLLTPTDTLQYQQRLLEQLREEEEEFYANNGGDGGESAKLMQLQPIIENYTLWQFAESPETTLTDVSLSFEPTTILQIDWGDGSVEAITTGASYNHTFS